MFIVELYFKDQQHEEDSNCFLKAFGKSDFTTDVEYGVLSYVLGAVNKKKGLMLAVDEEGIDIEKLYGILDVYSSSERSMIRFGVQCFNASIDDIKLADVVSSLDNENLRVVKTALDLRYFKRLF